MISFADNSFDALTLRVISAEAIATPVAGFTLHGSSVAIQIYLFFALERHNSVQGSKHKEIQTCGTR